MHKSVTIINSFPRTILYVVVVVLLVVTSISLWSSHKAAKAERHIRYVGILNLASEKISKTIRGMEMNAMNEFDEVEKHLDTPESVIAALESKTSLNPEVRGYFAAFEPNYFPSEGQWFEPYVHHVDDNDFEVRQVGSASHNYHKSEWYIRAKDTKESFWSDPYYYFDGTSISGHYTTFVKPIYDKTGNLACVCGADMTFEWLSKEVQQIDDDSRNNDLLNFFLLNDGGEFYTVVLNNDGSSIASPEGKPVKLTEDQLGQSLELRKSGMVEMKINGQHSTVYYTPIERVNWSVAVVVTDQGIAKAMIKFGIILLLITILGMIVVWLACRRLSLD